MGGCCSKSDIDLGMALTVGESVKRNLEGFVLNRVLDKVLGGQGAAVSYWAAQKSRGFWYLGSNSLLQEAQPSWFSLTYDLKMNEILLTLRLPPSGRDSLLSSNLSTSLSLLKTCLFSWS